MKAESVPRILARLVPVLILIALFACALPVHAQVRIVGAISGTVIDPTGAVVPGAKVALRDEGTNVTKETVSTRGGTFYFPDVAHGAYEVKVTAEGFQAAVVSHIQVAASQTVDVPVKLTVGATSQTITVDGSTEMLATATTTIGVVQTTELINELPNAARDAFGMASLVPGYASGRINGVAGGAMNVTVDGINDASNGYKSGGTVWYNTVPVRLGAVEEVTVEAGGLGADAGAESGVNIKMITKRGSSQYHGSLRYQPTSEQFNANSWSRNANPSTAFRTKNRTHTMGGNFGGPLVPFGYLKDKLFFFVNWEDEWQPARSVVNSTVMNAATMQGFYTYPDNNNPSITHTVNVLQLAGAAGLPTKIDPIVQKYMDHQATFPKYGVQIPSTDLNNTTWQWAYNNPTNRYYPATRMDYYVTPKNQVSFTWNYYHSWAPGSQLFPDPDSRWRDPYRVGYFVWSAALQSTITPTMVNEFRYGVQHSGDTNKSATERYGTYNAVNNVPLRIGSMPSGVNYYTLNSTFNTPVDYLDQANVTGRHFITTMYDTVTKQRGQHSIQAGFTYRRTDWKDTGETFPIPTYGLGTPAGVSYSDVFNTTTLPGINPNNTGTAGTLYNQLVGRVSQSNYSFVVDPATKQYGGFINYTWTRSYMGGLWAQDRWRIRPDLTINYGLRWEAQGDMYDVMGITAIPDIQSVYGPSKGLFQPGVLGGTNDPTATLTNQPYKPDLKNFAPNFGFAWNPTKDGGWLGRIFNGKTVIRGAWSINYYDEGTQMFAQNMGTNTGKQGSNNFAAGYSPALPLWSTLSSVVANPVPLSAFTVPQYQTTLHQTNYTFSRNFAGMDPNLKAPYVANYNFGFQREVARGTVLEVKYVGSQTHGQWMTYNINEVNIDNNGFLQEFKNAQANLAINRANGKGASFQYNGLPGQFQLPILAAAFGPRGTVPALAGSSSWTNTGFVNNLDNGAVGSMAGSIGTSSTYMCRMFGNGLSPCLRSGVAPTGQSYDAPGSGYPINFFIANPYSPSYTGMTSNFGWWDYNSLQTQLRHNFSHGLNWTVNYTWSHAMSNTGADSANMQYQPSSLRDRSQDRRPSRFDTRHSIQSFGTYDLPIGKDHWLNLNTSNSLVNKVFSQIFSGWTAGAILRWSTGLPVEIGGDWQTVNTSGNSGVVLGPGVTLQQLSDMVRGQTLIHDNQKSNSDPRLNRLNANDYTWVGIPLDMIGSNLRADPKYLAPCTTAGAWCQTIFIRDKNNFSLDASMTKTFQIRERLAFDLFASASNVLNHPSYGLPNLDPYSTSFGLIGAPSGNRTMTFRGILRF